MPLSNPFRRTADRPSLRERAAALRASFSPTTAAPVAMPAPGSEEAMAAFHAACHQDTIRAQGIVDGYPELKRSRLEWWTADSLSKAMETGEITPAECARLFPHATERELRLSEIHHDLNLGALHALAFANSYPVPTGPDADEEDDAELLALGPAWKGAVALYSQRIEDLGETEGASAARGVVEDAERAVRVAGDALHALEVQIGEHPALTIAGLRLKACVAKRCDSAEIVWPDGFGEGLARDILAMSEPEVEADADLLRIGRLFEAAREREIAACKACNAASREAQKHMPGRPGTLLYRASDHALYLHKHYTNPEYLDGREITSDDVEWVSRKRHVRDVRRPVRPEDKLPADAQFVVGQEPWPEAQARADEIVAAWEAWYAERNAVYAAHGLPRLEETADKAGDATAALAERLAAIPARTADGFRLKLRALAFYRHSVLEPELEDVSDPDQILSHSLWRDVQGEPPEAPPTHEPNLVSLIDLASASMEDLQAVHDTAQSLGDAAGAAAWTARCHTKGWASYNAPGDGHNAAGRLMHWLGDALSNVQHAANEEAKRRLPANSDDREIRWQIIARPVLENGDPAEITAFARELLTHAEAERAKG